MNTIYSAAEAAAQLNVSSRTVRRAAIAHGIGTQIGAMWIFTAAEISRLRDVIPGKIGNPNFVTGNDLWKLSKKNKK